MENRAVPFRYGPFSFALYALVHHCQPTVRLQMQLVNEHTENSADLLFLQPKQ
jgi:hypothetical protein